MNQDLTAEVHALWSWQSSACGFRPHSHEASEEYNKDLKKDKSIFNALAEKCWLVVETSERELLCHTSDFCKDMAEGYRYCSLSVSLSFLNSNTLKKMGEMDKR